jgi:hypothetical protein
MTDDQAAVLREAYRRSEKRLENQQALAIAFDSRSLLHSAVTVALLAYIVSNIDDGWAGWYFKGAAIMLTVSVVLSIVSAVPTRLYTAGSEHSELSRLIADGVPELAVIKGLAENNDRYIRRNDFAANVRVSVYRVSTIFLVIGLVISLIGLNLR